MIVFQLDLNTKQVDLASQASVKQEMVVSSNLHTNQAKMASEASGRTMIVSLLDLNTNEANLASEASGWQVLLFRFEYRSSKSGFGCAGGKVSAFYVNLNTRKQSWLRMRLLLVFYLNLNTNQANLHSQASGIQIKPNWLRKRIYSK